MEFTLTVRWADGKANRETHDLGAMRDELGMLAADLDALVLGEVIEIKRTA